MKQNNMIVPRVVILVAIFFFSLSVFAQLPSAEYLEKTYWHWPPPEKYDADFKNIYPDKLGEFRRGSGPNSDMMYHKSTHPGRAPFYRVSFPERISEYGGPDGRYGGGAVFTTEDKKNASAEYWFDGYPVITKTKRYYHPDTGLPPLDTLILFVRKGFFEFQVDVYFKGTEGKWSLTAFKPGNKFFDTVKAHMTMILSRIPEVPPKRTVTPETGSGPGVKSPTNRKIPGRSTSSSSDRGRSGHKETSGWVKLIGGIVVLLALGAGIPFLRRRMSQGKRRGTGLRRSSPVRGSPMTKDSPLPSASEPIQQFRDNLDLEKPRVSLNLDKGLDQSRQRSEGDREPAFLEITASRTGISAENPKPVDVRVHVSNAAGEPIPGITVFFDATKGDLAHRLRRTDAKGEATNRWRLRQGASGTASIRASGSLTRDVKGRVQIRIGEQHGSIVGRVVAPDAQPVKEARVGLGDRERGISRSAVTDGRGEFRFAELSASGYSLQAKKDYHRPVEQSVSEVMLQAGEQRRVELRLEPERERVRRMLASESRLFASIMGLLVTDSDSYLQSLAWEWGGFAASIAKDATADDSPPDRDRFLSLGSDEIRAGLKDLGLPDPSSVQNAAADRQLKIFDFFVNQVWKRVGSHLPIPDADRGFTDADLRALLAALATADSPALAHQAVKSAYVASLPEGDIQKLALAGNIHDFGDQPDRTQPLIFTAALLAFIRSYFNDNIREIMAVHREMHDYWGKHNDADLMAVFETEDRFHEFDKIINQRSDFLKEHRPELKKYALHNSKIAQILDMGERFVEDVAGGEDIYRSQLIKLAQHPINNLPLALRGYNYFVATSSIWGVLGLVSEASPHTKSFHKLMDMGYKFGAFGCLALGLPALEKDMASMRAVLQEILWNSRDRKHARDFVK